MRLRQVVFVARALEPAVDDIGAVLGLAVAYRDPGVGQWGLENAVMPLGGDFIEVVAPIRDGTSAGRYLDRRGGDGGYMVILQCADAPSQRARVAGLGIREIWRADRPDYRATQFHPTDVGGVILSLDSVEPGADYRETFCSWEPAGPDWRAAVRTEVSGALLAAELRSDDPAALAALWSRVLDLPAEDTGARRHRIALHNGELRFVGPGDGRGPGLSAIDVRAVDRARILAAAEARGLETEGGAVRLRGVRVNLV